MKISELARHQILWESDRGIKNGGWGVERIQQEVDEARDEDDLRRKLVELCDIIIVATGSAGVLTEYLGYEVEALESIISSKLAINDIKYSTKDGWDKDNWQGEMAKCRAHWLME
jgi:hypothetical protein